jgi:hypothetical protein
MLIDAVLRRDIRPKIAIADVDDDASPLLAWSPHHLPVSLRRQAQRSARAAQALIAGSIG